MGISRSFLLNELIYSHRHSVLTDKEFYVAQKLLQGQWDEFLQRVIRMYNINGNRFKN